MTRSTKIASAVIALALAGGVAVAQQPGFVRVALQDQPLSDPMKHAVQARAEFAPGVAAGKHTHPGEELGYVLEGEILLEIDGQSPRTVKAGESFFVPAGVVHDGKNTGSGTAKVLATYIVEKGKPVATPVK